MGDLDRIEKKLWEKDLLIGYTKPTELDKQRHKVILSASIKEKSGQKNWETLKPMKKFKTFSISGSSKDFGGQINDSITDDNMDWAVPKTKVKKIKQLWKEWHLNDVKAGTKAQEQALMGMKNYDYDKAVKRLKKKGKYNYKGYKYGHGWLVKPLPSNVEKQIRELF